MRGGGRSGTPSHLAAPAAEGAVRLQEASECAGREARGGGERRGEEWYTLSPRRARARERREPARSERGCVQGGALEAAWQGTTSELCSLTWATISCIRAGEDAWEALRQGCVAERVYSLTSGDFFSCSNSLSKFASSWEGC